MIQLEKAGSDDAIAITNIVIGKWENGYEPAALDNEAWNNADYTLQNVNGSDEIKVFLKDNNVEIINLGE